ncbi:MAG: carboxymuconolactone decarboxylase family protein [Betaproteobacteria bacterium]|nr:carboxymuconolactone decarboxylase family protein [Betaproteobacteria bacterium]
MSISRTSLAAFALLAAIAGPSAGQEIARIAAVPPDTPDPILAPLFDGIRKRGSEPTHMHRTLGNAPRLFKPYTDLAFAIRGAASVARVHRELIILRVTHLFQGEYEFAAHSPMAVSCGMTGEQVNGIRAWPQSRGLFDDHQQAILSYADGMASPASVNDATFAALQRFSSPQEIVELTMTAGFYINGTLVTRALGVKPTPLAPERTYGKC